MWQGKKEVKESKGVYLQLPCSPKFGKLPLSKWKQNNVNAQQVAHLSPDDGKVIYATEGTNVLSYMTDTDVTSLALYSHEEADTRLLLHAGDAANTQRAWKIAVDTDVVVLGL